MSLAEAPATPLEPATSAPRPAVRAPRGRAGPSRFLATSLALHGLAGAALYVVFPEHLGLPPNRAVISSDLSEPVEIAPPPEEPPPPPDPVERPDDEPPEEADEPPALELEPAFEAPVISVTDALANTPRVKAPAARRAVGRGGSGAGAAVKAPPPPPEPARIEPPPPPPREVVRTPARAISPRIPGYPEEARSSGVEGVVRLVIEVLEDGTVGDVEVAESSGSQVLDDAAIRAVRRWTFEPATEDGVAVRARVRVPPIRFRLTR